MTKFLFGQFSQKLQLLVFLETIISEHQTVWKKRISEFLLSLIEAYLMNQDKMMNLLHRYLFSKKMVVTGFGSLDYHWMPYGQFD